MCCMYDAILWFMFAYLLYIYMCDKYSTVWRQILKFEIKNNNYTGGTQSEPPVKNGFSQAANKVSRLCK